MQLPAKVFGLELARCWLLQGLTGGRSHFPVGNPWWYPCLDARHTKQRRPYFARRTDTPTRCPCAAASSRKGDIDSFFATEWCHRSRAAAHCCQCFDNQGDTMKSLQKQFAALVQHFKVEASE